MNVFTPEVVSASVCPRKNGNFVEEADQLLCPKMNRVDQHQSKMDMRGVIAGKSVLTLDNTENGSRIEREHRKGEHRKGSHCNDRQDTSKRFPQILRAILSDQSNSSSITWLPHGKAFHVSDRKKFIEEILPRYIGKTTKYTSFTRKLGRWNFNRVASGPDEGAWYKENFTRDESMYQARRSTEKKRHEQVNEFPRTKPLKKRPVDSSLFSAHDTPPIDYSQLIQRLPEQSLSFGSPHYICGGHPNRLADTHSVVEAAIEALIRSNSRNEELPIVSLSSYGQGKPYPFGVWSNDTSRMFGQMQIQTTQGFRNGLLF